MGTLPAVITTISSSSLMSRDRGSLGAQKVKSPPAMWETWFDPCVGKTPWRRERLPTPVSGPGEFQGLYSSWGCKEPDTTERLSLQTEAHRVWFYARKRQVTKETSGRDLTSELAGQGRVTGLRTEQEGPRRPGRHVEAAGPLPHPTGRQRAHPSARAGPHDCLGINLTFIFTK